MLVLLLLRQECEAVRLEDCGEGSLLLRDLIAGSLRIFPALGLELGQNLWFLLLQKRGGRHDGGEKSAVRSEKARTVHLCLGSGLVGGKGAAQLYSPIKKFLFFFVF